MAIQQESELYAPIKLFLEKNGYEVKSEVKDCDIVAVRSEGPPCIIELKRSFNLPLLFQGIDRLKLSEVVYVAVEHTRKGPYGYSWNEVSKLCRMLGLGLITVQFYKRKSPVVMIQCDPKPFTPTRSTKRFNALIQEFTERSGDYNIGGTTRKPIVTAYREYSLRIASLLKQHELLSVKHLREQTAIAKTASILQQNYYGWFERERKGIYKLTPLGLQALETYSKVIGEVD